MTDKITHLICHTGQHYDYEMSQAFFEDLGLPEPDFYLGVGSGSHSEQTGKIMIEFEKVCIQAKPDLVIVVGDVNSTIAATLTATKMGILTAHIEAGLRSFDRSMPEEINRIATDSICDFHFVTEQSGMDNLIREGHKPENIFFVGNTMIDSLVYILDKIEQSTILSNLGLLNEEFALMTLHRPSNVDDTKQLSNLIDVIEFICNYIRLVFPIHPRTRKNIEEFGLKNKIENIKNLIVTDPLGYIDFVKLMKNSRFIMTDSGGIQEEAPSLGKPVLVLRNVTERPEGVEAGTLRVVGTDRRQIVEQSLSLLTDRKAYDQMTRLANPYGDGLASQRIVAIIQQRFNDGF